MKKRQRMKEERGIALLALIIPIIVVVLIGAIALGNIGKKEEKSTKPVSTGEEQEDTNKEEFVYSMEDGSKLNVSEEMQKTKTVGSLKITNIQLKETKGITTLLADVENTGETDVEEKMITIDILDKSGQVITTIKGPIDTVKAGAKVQLNTAVTADVANAYDFKVRE